MHDEHSTHGHPEVGHAVPVRLLATVLGPMRALTETDYGPVTRELLSEIARNPELGDPFRRDALSKPVRLLENYKDCV